MKTKAFWVAIFLSFLVWFLAFQGPKVQDATYDAKEFSATRAMRDIEFIAHAPHELGSLEHQHVREYLVSRLQKMGAQTGIQSTFGFIERGSHSNSAPINNIYGVFKGKDSSLPAILILSHYDTQTFSPGAADDSTGVAVAIETARAILSRGTPLRDIVVMFSDGEEFGLLGAQAYFEEIKKIKAGTSNNPQNIPANIGVLINLEARGDSGLVYMFETFKNNQNIVDVFSKHGNRATGNSFATLVYSKMPNGTDFTNAKNLEIDGLNFAFMGNERAYHTELSTAQNLDKGSVQHMGNQILPVVWQLANQKEIGSAKSDAIFSDVLSRFMISYPLSFQWPLTVLLLLLTGLIYFRSHKKDEFKAKNILQGSLAGIGALAFSAVVLSASGKVLGDFWHSERLAYFELIEIGAFLVLFSSIALYLSYSKKSFARIGIFAISIIAGLVNFNLIGAVLAVVALIAIIPSEEKISNKGYVFGGLLINVILAIAATIFAPQTAPVLVWPVSLIALFWAIKTFARDIGFAKNLMFLSVVLVVAQMIGFGHLLMLSLGVDLIFILSPLAIILTFALSIFRKEGFDNRFNQFAGLVLVITGAVIVYLGANLAPSPNNPRANMTNRLEDLDKNKAYIITNCKQAPKFLLEHFAKENQKLNCSKIDGRDGEYETGWFKGNTAKTAPPKIEYKIDNGVLNLDWQSKSDDYIHAINFKKTKNVGKISLNGFEILKDTKEGDDISITRIFPQIAGQTDGKIQLSIELKGKGALDLIFRESQNHAPPEAGEMPHRTHEYIPIYWFGYNQNFTRKKIEF